MILKKIVVMMCMFMAAESIGYSVRNGEDMLLDESNRSSDNVYAYQDVPMKPVLVNGASLAAFLLVLSKKRYVASAVSILAAANVLYYTKFRKYLY